MAKIEKIISRKIDKAIFQFNMIELNEHIVIGLSGGKDSLALAYYLTKKAQSGSYPIPFTVEAVHVRSDFTTQPISDELLGIVESWGLKVSVLDVPIAARVKPGRKLNCWWCSTQRRIELFGFAESVGSEKLALGHHLDDILETFLMNMSAKGELSTMLPAMHYDNYSQTLIRPLAWVHEDELIRFNRHFNLEGLSCTCEWDTRSPRRQARRALEELAAGRPKVKDSMFSALSNPVNRYLPQLENPGEHWGADF